MLHCKTGVRSAEALAVLTGRVQGRRARRGGVLAWVKPDRPLAAGLLSHPCHPCHPWNGVGASAPAPFRRLGDADRTVPALRPWSEVGVWAMGVAHGRRTVVRPAGVRHEDLHRRRAPGAPLLHRRPPRAGASGPAGGGPGGAARRSGRARPGASLAARTRRGGDGVLGRHRPAGSLRPHGGPSGARAAPRAGRPRRRHVAVLIAVAGFLAGGYALAEAGEETPPARVTSDGRSAEAAPAGRTPQLPALRRAWGSPIPTAPRSRNCATGWPRSPARRGRRKRRAAWPGVAARQRRVATPLPAAARYRTRCDRRTRPGSRVGQRPAPARPDGVRGGRRRAAAGAVGRAPCVALRRRPDPARRRQRARRLVGRCARRVWQVERMRLAHPVRSSDGRWVVAGWAACRFVPGTLQPRYDAMVEASLRLHAATAGLPRPRLLDDRDDLSTRAAAAAWGERTLKLDPRCGWGDLRRAGRRAVARSSRRRRWCTPSCSAPCSSTTRACRR